MVSEQESIGFPPQSAVSIIPQGTVWRPEDEQPTKLIHAYRHQPSRRRHQHWNVLRMRGLCFINGTNFLARMARRRHEPG